MNRVQPSYSLTSTMWLHFGELEAGESTDGVKVRVVRCYRQPSPHKSDPDGTLEMVLHDEHIESVNEEVNKLDKGNEKVDFQKTLEDDNENAVAVVNVEDVHEKKSSGSDVKYTSNNKKMKVKQ
ncbi:hypothetical protein CASFOL_011463 [Castilleja foliolosa]|uniref:Uncharacterized protein n=1 Tax=Castilleja foliolosa TaxID=1961234 RepID=A0ABD3DVJ1_9LAMI